MKRKSRHRTNKQKRNNERSIGVEMRKYIESLGITAQKHRNEENMIKFYATTRKLAWKYSWLERPVENKGKLVTKDKDQRNVQVEHFEELLNRTAQLKPLEIKIAHTDLPEGYPLPTIKGIIKIIRQIKNGKAGGTECIPVEAMKSDIEVTPNIFHVHFRKTWIGKIVEKNENRDTLSTYWRKEN